MDKFQTTPIIVRRVKKGGGGHHGGAWKVALADFAMAMMALFILLWIINSSNEQLKEAISGYFQDPKAWEEGKKVPSPYVIDLGGSPSVSDNISESETVDPTKVLQADEIESAAEAIERKKLEPVKDNFEEKMILNPTLSPYKDQLLMDITSEGLRIQIVDQTKRPMFDPGKATLKYYAEDILFALAPILESVPNKITITGHTDTSGSANPWDKGNWELSAARANSARRALSDAGLAPEKIAQVVGMGDTAPFDLNNPGARINRRISIIVMNKLAQKAVESRAGGYEDIESKKLGAGKNIKPKAEGKATKDKKRDKAIKTTGTLIEKLKEDRQKKDNSYDNPPNEEEAFW